MFEDVCNICLHTPSNIGQGEKGWREERPFSVDRRPTQNVNLRLFCLYSDTIDWDGLRDNRDIPSSDRWDQGKFTEQHKLYSFNEQA